MATSATATLYSQIRRKGEISFFDPTKFSEQQVNQKHKKDWKDDAEGKDFQEKNPIIAIAGKNIERADKSARSHSSGNGHRRDKTIIDIILGIMNRHDHGKRSEYHGCSDGWNPDERLSDNVLELQHACSDSDSQNTSPSVVIGRFNGKAKHLRTATNQCRISGKRNVADGNGDAYGNRRYRSRQSHTDQCRDDDAHKERNDREGLFNDKADA